MENPVDPGQSKDMNSIFEIFLGLLSSYGWHIVFFLVIANLIYSHVKPKLQQWKNNRHDQQLATEYQQNPEKILNMQESMMRSRQRMQEEQDRLSQERLEKQKQLEKEKQEEKIKKWQCIQDGSSFSIKKNDSESITPNSTESQSKSKSTSPKLRGQNYNPLMGSDNGACYRPSRRVGRSAGG